jgi:hypothetical protein
MFIILWPVAVGFLAYVALWICMPAEELAPEKETVVDEAANPATVKPVN